MVGIFFTQKRGVVMQLFLLILGFIFEIIRLVLMIYSGWKFLSGDKKKNSTLYYGILFVATLM
ncbi:MAG: hypothetical protein EGR48_00240 [Lachnospiraceae bacterium]|nr:hypothetical protein [Lachnospiraceae bacterium]